MNILVFLSFFVAAVCAVEDNSNSNSSSETDKNRNTNSTRNDTRLCFVKKVFNGRVVSVTSIGRVLPEEAAEFERGRIWRRPSRLGNTVFRGNTHGRGSASVLAALCNVCRKRNHRRCLQQFCRVVGRNPRLKIEVVCLG